MGDLVVHGPNYHSLRIQEELELADATELGLSSTANLATYPSWAPEDVVPDRWKSQLSPTIDPVYVFRVVIYYLTNNLEETDEIYDFMVLFARQIPWYLLEAFLRLDSPMIQQSLSKLLDWAFCFGEKSFFESIAWILMENMQWIKWHGARFFTTAARYDCHEICKRLIHHGISPDQTYKFPQEMFSGKYSLSDFRERKTARRYVSYESYSGCLSSPLIEAAVRGNIRTVKAILDGGADVNLRYGNFTAAGYLLHAFATDNLDRERRLTVIQLLLENGADVHEPFCEHVNRFNLGHGEVKLLYSEETLFDVASLSGDSELAELFRKFDQTPESQLTISNVIFNAKCGIGKLQEYLHIASFPRGLRRQRIQELSLYWCFGDLEAFLVMVRAGFDRDLVHYMKTPVGCLSSSRSPKDSDTIEQLIMEMCESTTVTSLSADIVSFLLSKEIVIKARLIGASLNTRSADGLQYLLNNGLKLTEQHGVMLMAEAARRDNFAAVALLLNYGVEINGTVRVEKDDCSVLLLAVIPMVVDNELSVLQRPRVTGVEMLDFLVRQGGDISTCRPVLQSSLQWSREDCGEESTMKWLIDNGLDLAGYSICSIMIRRLQCCYSLDILRALISRNVPIFSPGEPFRDDRSFDINIHPLSFFIQLEPGLDFIYQVLETGIDVNGTGRDVRLDTPLRAAAKLGDIALVKVLISRGALTRDMECRSPYTSLQMACGLVHFDMAKALLESGADPNQTGSYDSATPLQMALVSSTPDIHFIHLLLDYGADVNALAWGRRSFDHDYHEALYLYTDPDAKWSILHIALTVANHLGVHKRRVIGMLIDRGARINARSMARGLDSGPGPGQSALEAVCQRGGLDCIDFVTLLLDRGATLDPPMNYQGSSALEIACSTRNIDLVKLLLDRGMSPNPRFGLRLFGGGQLELARGPLAIAAANGDIAVVLLLLAAGARVSVGSEHVGYYGCSSCPLAAAAYKGRLDTVALLLDLETREEAFDWAISAARRKGHLAIASYIQKHVDGKYSPPLEVQEEELDLL